MTVLHALYQSISILDGNARLGTGPSNSTIRRKSLYSGRSVEDQRRRELRWAVFPQVLEGLIL